MTPQSIMIGNNSGEFSLNNGFNIYLGHMAGQNDGGLGSNMFLGHESGLFSFTGESNIYAGNKSGMNNSFTSHPAFSKATILALSNKSARFGKLSFAFKISSYSRFANGDALSSNNFRLRL